MKVAFYMNCLSAHQIPLAREVAKLIGAENFCYIDAGEKSELAQSVDVSKFQGFKVFGAIEGREWLETADVMLTGMRDLELLELRAKNGLKTYYASERWFKPVEIGVGGRCRVAVSGFLRMLVPSYRRMMKRFVKWVNEDQNGYALTYGPWAGVDFRKMGVRPEKIVNWAYFVAPSALGIEKKRGSGQQNFSILWCGRMLALKRVETIIRAVKKMEKAGGGGRRNVSLTIVGDGPEKARLMRLAEQMQNKGGGEQWNLSYRIEFLPSQPMEKVRELMRQHDLFVFPSNGYEGWGAVVSEALEEGMRVLASYECGAGAALLPRERLFHSGDWHGLARLIEKDMRCELPSCSIGEWTAKIGARRIVGLDSLNGGRYRNGLICDCEI